MKRAIAAAAAVCVLALTGPIAAQAAPPAGQLCDPLSTGRIDVSGDVTSITFTAPEGMVITEVCVKAGSAKQGLGAEYTIVDDGTVVILTHSSGKGISHYSVSYEPGGYGPVS